MVITRFLLIRHAETIWNKEGRVQGYADSPLTLTGKDQAKQLAPPLFKEHINAVYSSDSKRCTETARIAFDGTPPSIQLLKDLRERNLGDWEGKIFTDVIKKEPLATNAYRIDASFRPPKGETFIEMQDRVFKTIQKIKMEHSGQVVAVFTSGGSLRAIVMAVLKSDPNGWSGWATSNAGMTILEHRSGRWRLLQFNSTAHLSTINLEKE